MSAIIPEDGEMQPDVAKVLLILHPGFDTLDAMGPLEAMSHARHNANDESESLLKSIGV